MEWNEIITTMMKSKDLNIFEFIALVGHLINYEINLKFREVKAKGKAKETKKERNIALKAFTKSGKGSLRSSDER